MLITDIRQASPNLITALFRVHGVMGDDEQIAKVRKLSTTDAKGEHAIIHTLALQYKDFRTQRHAPDKIMLKLTLPDADLSRLQYIKNEVTFYERIAAPLYQQHDPRDLPMPFCYDVYYDETQQQAHFVLQSADGYRPAPTIDPPSQRHREQLMDGLARLHGRWWSRPLAAFTTMPGEDSLSETERRRRERYDAMLEFVGQQLSAPHRDMLSRIAQGIPAKRRQQLIDGTGITAVHSALEPSCILYSHEGVMIQGWQHWRSGIATDDLAYMIGCFWSGHLRKFQEKAMLKRYYNGLVRAGVTGYSYDDLEYDYRVSLAVVIGDFLAEWTKQKHLRGYWQRAERALDVFIEWDGQQVLEAT